VDVFVGTREAPNASLFATAFIIDRIIALKFIKFGVHVPFCYYLL